MKEMLTQYATYNIWANNELLKLILNLSEEQQQQEIASSFSSLYKTILHLWTAKSIWWQRLKLHEHIAKESDNCTSIQEASKAIQQLDVQWADWISKANENQLQHVFAYQNSKREQFKQAVWQMLLHLFNHSTYHRGQLVTMLRQLGIEKIPQTDFIYWCRKK